jgi:hypothetical protein
MQTIPLARGNKRGFFILNLLWFRCFQFRSSEVNTSDDMKEVGGSEFLLDSKKTEPSFASELRSIMKQ